MSRFVRFQKNMQQIKTLENQNNLAKENLFAHIVKNIVKRK